VEAGRFRRDLFYRLNVFPVPLPPLRARTGDIALLAQHFFHRYNAHSGKQLKGITAAALRCLERYPWPGNVRELKNELERAVALDASLVQLHAAPEEDRVAERVPAAVEELDRDPRVAPDAAEWRLLRKLDGLTRRENDDVHGDVLGVRVGASHVVPEDQAGVDPPEGDLSRQRDERSGTVDPRPRR